MAVAPNPCYSAEVQGFNEDPRDDVTYFRIMVSEIGVRQWCVDRRYSAFESLAEGLHAQLPGLPPMPPKSFFRRRCLPGFMRERQVALGNLLRYAVQADPTLSYSPALQQFLGVQEAQPAFTAPMQPAYPQAMPAAQSVPAAAAPQVAVPAAPAVPVAQAVPAAQPVPAAAAPQMVAPSAPAAAVVQGAPVAQACALPAYAQPSYSQPAYSQQAYSQQGYAQPGYAQPACAQLAYAQPAYAQPAYAQPGCAQPGYAQPAFAQPAYMPPGCPQPVYGQSAYAQPGYSQPAYQHTDYASPYPTPYEEQPSHGSGMGKVVGVGLAAGAAGLVGGMLLEGALEDHHRQEFMGGGLPGAQAFGGPGLIGGPGFFGSEEVMRDVHTDMFGDTEVRTEVVDRDVFGRVEDVRETVVDQDAFGGITREEVIIDDGW